MEGGREKKVTEEHTHSGEVVHGQALHIDYYCTDMTGSNMNAYRLGSTDSPLLLADLHVRARTQKQKQHREESQNFPLRRMRTAFQQ